MPSGSYYLQIGSKFGRRFYRYRWRDFCKLHAVHGGQCQLEISEMTFTDCITQDASRKKINQATFLGAKSSRGPSSGETLPKFTLKSAGFGRKSLSLINTRNSCLILLGRISHNKWIKSFWSLLNAKFQKFWRLRKFYWKNIVSLLNQIDTERLWRTIYTEELALVLPLTPPRILGLFPQNENPGYVLNFVIQLRFEWIIRSRPYLAEKGLNQLLKIVIELF